MPMCGSTAVTPKSNFIRAPNIVITCAQLDVLSAETNSTALLTRGRALSRKYEPRGDFPRLVLFGGVPAREGVPTSDVLVDGLGVGDVRCRVTQKGMKTMPKPQGPTRLQAIQLAVRGLNKPLTFDELQNAVRVIVPISDKSLQSALRDLEGPYPDTNLIQRTPDGRYGWLPSLVHNAVLRHALSAKELKKNQLLFEPEIVVALWTDISPWRHTAQSLTRHCLLPDGTRFAVTPEMLGERDWSTVWGIRGEPALWEWLQGEHAQDGDALLLRIEDAATVSITHEPRAQRDASHMAQRNRALADAAFQALKPRRAGLRPLSLAARLLGLGLYHDPCPPDSLEVVLAADERFRWDRDYLKVATRSDRLYSALGLEEDLDDIFGDKPRAPKRKRPSRKELAQKVYRFHATFRRSTSPWRRIEIRGDQTLRQFDDEMRRAFRHDFSDHLSEFYLGTDSEAHRRGLGDHEPGGGGAGADWMVGELGLESGDTLSYTYDFGDNIQHTLTLEAVIPPEPGIKYPRVAEQNKPRYHYCEHCQAQGKKEIATWFCITCANDQQREVRVCSDHIASEHEDHYAEEIVY